MKGLVHRRTGQVVHGRVDDAKVLLFAGLQIQHLGQAHTRVAHQRAAGFDHQLALAVTPGVELGQQLRPQRIGLGRRVAVVVDAQAAAKVNVVDGDARRFDLGHQVQHAVHGVQIGGAVGDLRADVAVDAHHLQAGQAGRVTVGAQRVFVCNAEFVAFEAGRDVGMGFGVHIGVHAQADRGHFPQVHRYGAEHIEFGFAFDVEAANAHLQGLLHLVTCFAHARKNHFGRVAPGGQHAGQLAARDDVKATTGIGKHLQDGQAGVGLHGVANLRLASGKATLVGGQGRQHGGFGINEKGRAELSRQ